MRFPVIALCGILVSASVLTLGGCASDNYPGEPVLNAERHTAPGALVFYDLAPGSGEAAKPGDVIHVHYSGYLMDGKKFDSSLDRNEPLAFQLGVGRVIRGWDEGVVGMKVGGKRKLVIPSNLAYGERGMGSTIPPDSRLVFDIELVSIEQR
jgi:FKBP-type peptidyl-prolyl cis-trans isomerase FkpA